VVKGKKSEVTRRLPDISAERVEKKAAWLGAISPNSLGEAKGDLKMKIMGDRTEGNPLYNGGGRGAGSKLLKMKGEGEIWPYVGNNKQGA